MDATFPNILSEHPVEPSVRQRILQSLDEIETRHRVTIIFACESGSRGWGFASPDSDYDVRFIYVPRLPWYLQVNAARDVIELPLDDELDINGWELRKALQLLQKSNPTLLEWLDSPIVYRENEATMRRMREIAATQFAARPVHHHYLAMAQKNFREHLQGEHIKLKKYLYVLRPLLAVHWVNQGLGAPPMRFAELVRGTVSDATLLQEINDLLAVKMRSNESEYGAPSPALQAFIASQLANPLPAPEAPADGVGRNVLDGFLADTVLALNHSD